MKNQNIKSGEKIFLKNRTVEKMKHRIGQLTKWIWQIDSYHAPTHRQLLERDKYYNQKEAMLKEISTR